MAGERNYLRVPPDSTGKRIAIKHTLKIYYAGKISQETWDIDSEYTLGTSGLKVNLHDWYESTSTTGYIIVILNEDDRDGNLEPVGGETITHTEDNDLVAYVSNSTAWEDIYINQTTIVGGHPEHELSIDNTGSASVRFSEGTPQLDAFGKLRVSQSTILGDYNFSNSSLPYDFSNKVVGNASLNWDATQRCIELICPSVVAPAVGSVDAPLTGSGTDRVTQTSNTYHHYFPSFSQTYTATVALGDDGKDNVNRSWGLFDEFNGYGFRVDDSTNGLKLFVRSNVSGSIVETIITQPNFNGDKCDGTGPSKKTLDLQSDNIYWIDIQWLGAGRIRFGTYNRGARITMHEHYWDENAGYPHTATASLPICYFNEHTSGTVLASEAVLRAWCASVTTDQTLDVTQTGANNLETITHTFDPNNIANGQQYELMGVLAPVKTIADNPHINRTLYLPQYMEVLAYDQAGNPAFVEVEIYVNANIGGGSQSFSVDSPESGTPYLVLVSPQDPICGVEIYKAQGRDAKLWGGGLHAAATYVNGSGRTSLSSLYNNAQNGSLKNLADNGGTRKHAISSVTPGATTIVNVPEIMHREGYPVRFTDIVGTAGDILNYDPAVGNEYYLRIVSATSFELYEDILFTTPVDTSGLTYTSGGMMVGDFGGQMYFCVVCKPLTPALAATSITVHWNMGWKEINQ